MESPTAGLIVQLKGKLTLQRYYYATVFTDQYSRFSFIYLQKRIKQAMRLRRQNMLLNDLLN